MLNRPAFFAIVKIKVVSDGKNVVNICIPFLLFGLFPLIDSLDDFIRICTSFTIKQKYAKTVSRIIKGCSVVCNSIMRNLMLSGKLDLVDIDVVSGLDKVEVKVLLR